ncbi:MAG: hypothetical protein LVS60_06145 [Nodosilinea sp. LVE1205-7]|jgi:hypothetical protein
MGRFRPLLAIVLAVVVTCLMACGGPAVKVPPTYTPEVLQRIELYRSGVDSLPRSLPRAPGLYSKPGLGQRPELYSWPDGRTEGAG